MNAYQVLFFWISNAIHFNLKLKRLGFEIGAAKQIILDRHVFHSFTFHFLQGEPSHKNRRQSFFNRSPLPWLTTCAVNTNRVFRPFVELPVTKNKGYAFLQLLPRV